MTDEDSLLDKTLKILFDKAFEDGLVTDDEFEIIQTVEINIEKYTEALDKALEDNIITSEEADRLEQLKKEILKKAQEVAEIDGVVDEEETALLKKLTEALNKYFHTTD